MKPGFYADGTAPLSALFMFQPFSTREQARLALGVEPPPYNPNIPVKNWIDKTAAGKRIVVYGGFPVRRNDRIEIEEYELSGKTASTLNMLPDNFTALSEAEKRAALEDQLPVPLRALEPTEEFWINDSGGTIGVRDTALMPPSTAGSFTPSDRAILKRCETLLQSCVDLLTFIVEAIKKGFQIPAGK